MTSKAATVQGYLDELPPDRRAVVSAVLQVMRKNVPNGVVEAMSYGLPGFVVPHSIYPAGYHCDPKQPLPFVGLAAQKNSYSVYLMCLYQEPEFVKWFQDQYRATGKKLDMGKGCVRFRKLEDFPLDLLARTLKKMTLKKFIASYEKNLKK